MIHIPTENIIQVITQPTVEPVSLAQAQTHLRVDDESEENSLILSLIQAARQTAELWTGRSFLPQVIKETFPTGFPSCQPHNPDAVIRLGRAPVNSIISVENVDKTDGSSTPIAAEDYELLQDETYAYIYPKNKNWNVTADHKAVITYNAGYADADSVPKPIYQAILLMVGSWYENRQDSVRQMPTASECLLHPYRLTTL